MPEKRMDDMGKRLYTIALFGKLVSQLRTKSTSLAGYGFKTLDQQTLMCFYALRYIMEKTLQNEDCFLEDIALFLLEVNRDLFHLPLLLEDCRSLALLLISDVIGNAGEPIVFSPFEDAQDMRVSLRYIDSRLVNGPSGTTEVSYQMVDDGFHLMLSTLEMEENMRLQFRDLIFQMQLKARNYARALDEIRQIFQLLRIRETEIDQKQTALRSNAALIDPEQYRQLNEETLSLMSESRTKFEGYRQEVSVQQESLRRVLNGSDPDEESSLEQLADLGRIESWLSRSILSLERIINLLMEFSITYDQELKEQLMYASMRRRSFRKDIYDRILDNPDLLDGFDRLIQPLFFKDPARQMNLTMALQYRQLYANPEDGTLEEAESDWDEQREKERRLQIQKEMNLFNEAVQQMMERLLQAQGQQMRLSDMSEGILQEGTAQQCKQLFAGFASLARLDLQDLQEQAGIMIEEERTSFSLPLSILDAMEGVPALKEYSLLTSSRKEETFSRVFEEDGIGMTLTCRDLLFSLKK